ncbi:MAG: hypothetical protein IJD21_03370 [Oscillospiraceae bacterium]|nr:hypothetical protein [Oscillospiraceae bacterium]
MNKYSDPKQFLEELKALILKQGEVACEEYRKTMEEFYSSPESRLGLENDRLIHEARVAWRRTVGEPVISLIKEAYPQRWKELLSPTPYHGVSVEDGASLLYRNSAYVLEMGVYPSPTHVRLPEELSQLGRQRKEIYSQTLRSLWKSILLLKTDKTTGESWFYDQELKCFFRLKPDENFYHWGTYEYYHCNRDEVEAIVERDLSALPENQALSGYFCIYQNDYRDLPEIYHRLTSCRPATEEDFRPKGREYHKLYTPLTIDVPFTDLLNDLQATLLETAQQELNGYRAQMEHFYLSPESRQGKENQRFRREMEEAWYRTVFEAGMAFIKDRCPQVLERMDWASKYIGELSRKSGPRAFYSYFAWILFADSKLNTPQNIEADQAPRQALQKMEDKLKKSRAHALNHHWKPIVLLSIAGEDMDTNYYYDEELCFFFRLSPENNYGRRNSWNYCPVSKEAAENACGMNFDHLKVNPVSPYLMRYLDDYQNLPEIALRVPAFH